MSSTKQDSQPDLKNLNDRQKRIRKHVSSLNFHKLAKWPKFLQQYLYTEYKVRDLLYKLFLFLVANEMDGDLARDVTFMYDVAADGNIVLQQYKADTYNTMRDWLRALADGNFFTKYGGNIMLFKYGYVVDVRAFNPITKKRADVDEGGIPSGYEYERFASETRKQFDERKREEKNETARQSRLERSEEMQNQFRAERKRVTELVMSTWLVRDDVRDDYCFYTKVPPKVKPQYVFFGTKRHIRYEDNTYYNDNLSKWDESQDDEDMPEEKIKEYRILRKAARMSYIFHTNPKENRWYTYVEFPPCVSWNMPLLLEDYYSESPHLETADSYYDRLLTAHNNKKKIKL